MESTRINDIDGYLVLKLDEKKAIIELSRVKEILGMRECTRIPSLPKYMLGVINVRGQIVPVCDLRLRFSLNAIQDAKTCIMIVDTKQGELGLVVNELQNIKRKINLSKIQKASDSSYEFLKGYYLENDDVFYVLDFME